MEALLAAGLAGSGFLLHQNGKNDRRVNQENGSSYVAPNQSSMYESNYIDAARKHEQTLASQRMEMARNPIETNIVPTNMNQTIYNTQNTATKYLQSSLTGEYKQPADFTHQNMVPFFGAHIRQINADKSNAAILETYTGNDSYQQEKMEPRPLFNPVPQQDKVYGTQNYSDNIMSRIQTSTYRQGELPFEQERVGPGLNAGFATDGAGGFHQDPRDYVMPRTIDELRPLSKPQISYCGRVVAGKDNVDKRGQIGIVEKNRPDRFFIQDPDRYLTTTGAYTKEMKRPTFVVKDTNRKISQPYSGAAGTTGAKGERKRQLYKVSTRQNYCTDGPRNAAQQGAWGNVTFGNYGKSGVSVFTNERDITGQRTHVTNLVSLVKAITAPVLDVFRTSRKENAQGNPRESGNINATHIGQNVVWDPNDVARTTIKETTIDNNHEGFLAGPTRNVAYDSNDVARTTLKETLIDNTHEGFIKGVSKISVYDPDDVTRTTNKETTLFTREGNMGHNGQLGYITNEQEAPNTNRQFSGDFEYEGTAHGVTHKEPMVYDTDYNARLNVVREGTLVGREPTQESTKIWNGVDSVNVENTRKVWSDSDNTRQLASNKVYNSIPQKIDCSYTSDRNNYEDKDADLMNSRTDPSILDAYKNNPYTQRLDSYAYN
jgi:hypothetical protein